MEFAEPIITGVAGSFIFLAIMSYVRPTVRVCEKICKIGDNSYSLKFVNMSMFHLIDITCTLDHCTLDWNGHGHNIKYENIGRTEIDHLAPMPLIYRFIKDKGGAPYAFVLTTDKDLKKIWSSTDNSYYSFRITAKHSLSGFGKVIQREYKDRHSHIAEGIGFAHGKSIKFR
jgi:hypothetical protein